MIANLNELDTQLFLLINGFHSSFFDPIMLFISAKLSWLPLYIFLLYLIIKQYKKKSWLILAFVVLLITLADQLSVHAFKNTFQRLRPCYNEDIEGMIHLLKYCGGQFGFVSSHATNSFALVVFLSLLLRKTYSYIPALLLTWGFLIAYSRVYLGVHYPGDVIGGAFLGATIGLIVFLMYQFTLKKIVQQVK